MINNFLIENSYDPNERAMQRNGCRMRTYQSEALRGIYEGVLRHNGDRFTVTFPRQSGKNETQAQLESAVMAVYQFSGGDIIKLLPTEKNQGETSIKRLEKMLYGSSFSTLKAVRVKKQEVQYGSTRVRCLSASPNASIVGATASLMLEVDEAQLISPAKFDREVLPMAASSNAAVICWGTVWDDQTLLSRETRLAQEKPAHAFRTTAAEVSAEVPAYADFVRSQISLMGREHPAIRTQFFCEEISDLTGMFTPERIKAMQGSHIPQDSPTYDHAYVFLIDIAGSDEMTAESRRANGFYDRRDATVLTICDVTLPPGVTPDPKSYIWNVAARRYYRNLPAEKLEEYITHEVEHWNPRRIILDHSGLGCMLSNFLSRKYPHICFAWDITPANKTRMAWEFLSMIDSGRWREYHVDELAAQQSLFKPGKDHYEVLSDPALLQQMFTRELRACRMEPSGNGMTVRWGVKDGTRDKESGRYLHDDLVMSAALSVFLEGDLGNYQMTEEEIKYYQEEEEKWERLQRRLAWERS